MKAIVPLLLLAVTWPAEAGDLIARDVSRLTLRAQAQVRGDTVTLADVLSFAQADPRLPAELGHLPAVADRPAATVVTHDEIVRRLEELGVNLSRVLVAGALACEVTVESPTATPRQQPALHDNTAGEGTLLVRPRPAKADKTLADVLQARVARELASLGGTAEVEFERAGQEFLALTSPPWEFSVRGSNGRKLGLREFRVVIRRDGRTQRTARVAANVRLVKRVLVARKALGVGTFAHAADVGLESRVFDSADELGLDQSELIVGQQVKCFIPVGAMVRSSDLKAVDLVKRSRPVTVVGAGGGVRVRVTGVALDTGGYGDAVRVRIGDARRDRRELRGVVTGLATVRISEDMP
jgi:flagella basal body P-ring formation protein FlgA